MAWALHRFQVGSGTFLRTKMVAIHLNSQDTPAVQRGWLNSRTQEVQAMLGDVHATLEVTTPEELNTKTFCERLQRLFAADDLGEYSLQALQRDYESAVQQCTQHRQLQLCQDAARERRESPSPTRQPQPEVTAEMALRAVGTEGGSHNWALLEPSMRLHACGSGGLEEMKQHLADDQVLFGVLRLSFGKSTSSRRSAAFSLPGRGCSTSGGASSSSTARVTKHVFVHWMGPRVGAVQRGRWNAHGQEATLEVGRHCAVAMRKEARRLQDVSLEDIIADLRRLTALDVAAISSEGYFAALLEEAREREAQARREREARLAKQAAAQRAAVAAAAAAQPSLGDALAAVRDPNGSLNWVLCGWQQPPPMCLTRAALSPHATLGPRLPNGCPCSPALGGC